LEGGGGDESYETHRMQKAVSWTFMQVVSSGTNVL
jgi:hypothetical protein